MIRVLEKRDPRQKQVEDLASLLLWDYIVQLEKHGETEGKFSFNTSVKLTRWNSPEEKIEDFKKALDIAGYTVTKVKNNAIKKKGYKTPTGGWQRASTEENVIFFFKKKKENEK